MSFNLTTSQACIDKAGVFANLSGAPIAEWCDMAEANVCAETRRDWVALSAATKTNFKGILSDVVSDKVGFKIVRRDESGYVSRYAWQTILDSLDNNIAKNIAILKDDKNKEVMFA